MTGEKRTETRMRCYNTLCIPYISLHPSLHACIVYDCREGRGVIYREYTECYSISFLFLFFFHQSSLYPIKIFAKCFYLLVINYGCPWPIKFVYNKSFVIVHLQFSDSSKQVWKAPL